MLTHREAEKVEQHQRYVICGVFLPFLVAGLVVGAAATVFCKAVHAVWTMFFD